jgi:hypothetical protein
MVATSMTWKKMLKWTMRMTMTRLKRTTLVTLITGTTRNKESSVDRLRVLTAKFRTLGRLRKKYMLRRINFNALCEQSSHHLLLNEV